MAHAPPCVLPLVDVFVGVGVAVGGAGVLVQVGVCEGVAVAVGPMGVFVNVAVGGAGVFVCVAVAVAVAPEPEVNEASSTLKLSVPRSVSTYQKAWVSVPLQETVAVPCTSVQPLVFTGVLG